MFKTTLKVSGMMCGMCEAHMNDAVRNSFPVKSVSSNHKKETVEIISEDPIPEESIAATVKQLGYDFNGYDCQPYKKKGFFSFK